MLKARESSFSKLYDDFPSFLTECSTEIVVVWYPTQLIKSGKALIASLIFSTEFITFFYKSQNWLFHY